MPNQMIVWDDLEEQGKTFPDGTIVGCNPVNDIVWVLSVMPVNVDVMEVDDIPEGTLKVYIPS